MEQLLINGERLPVCGAVEDQSSLQSSDGIASGAEAVPCVSQIVDRLQSEEKKVSKCRYKTLKVQTYGVNQSIFLDLKLKS